MKFVQIPGRDQDRALRFYRDTMGFTVTTDASYGDDRWIEIAIPGAETRLVFTKRADDAVPQTPTVVLVSDDVQGDFTALRAKSATFTQEPTETPWEKGKFYALLRHREQPADARQFLSMRREKK